MAKPTTPTAVPVTPVVKPGFWSTMSDFFGMATVAVSTGTTIITAVNDLAVAAQAQTSIIKDTSINDADIKRIDLDDRMAARKAKSLPAK